MQIEIRIPSPGESISEVEISRWLIDNNSWVDKDQELAEVESEKATLPLLASQAGIVSIKAQIGTIRVGAVACTIDIEAKKPEGISPVKELNKTMPEQAKQNNVFEETPPASPTKTVGIDSPIKVTPLARKLMDEKGFDIEDILKGLKKITTREVNAVISGSYTFIPNEVKHRSEEMVPMSQLRKKLSQRLVAVKNETAMLSTFHEVDMSRIIGIRNSFQKDFQEKHGVKLGLMSFFTKAVVEALKQHPMVNSRIGNDNIISPNYYDIGIAVQTPKGLMVPVLRNAETLSFAQIELGINRLAEKGKVGRIGLDDLEGGTFTITNGGVFGSMLSTPLLNPPQSGILGMHSIIERPVAVNGKVEIRPMMYLALSYDHRIIDGKDSVGFLVKVKQLLENPQNMILGSANPDKILLGL